MKQRRISSAHVMSATALFIALGGTSYAITVTGADVRNSSLTGRDVRNRSLTGADARNNSFTGRQIKDLALTDFRRGTRFPTGPQGPAGASGPQGPQGPAGLPTTPLPSGLTMRGVFRSSAGNVALASIANTAYTFPVPLASEPTPNFVPENGPPTANCPGTEDQPEAAPGQLCLYEEFASANVGTSQSIGNPVTNSAPGASRFGFQFGVQANAPGGNMTSVGSWAVTAP